jgi:anti-anti-sigma regulatory factor
MDKVKPRKPRAPRKAKDAAPDGGDHPIVEAMTPPQQAEVPADGGTAVALGAAEPPVPADTTVHLNSSLEIKDVESVHRQLLSMLDRGPTVTVDISHVASMDTAGVQLLFAFQIEAVKRCVAVQYSGQSTAFTHALTAVGLGDAIAHVVARD